MSEPALLDIEGLAVGARQHNGTLTLVEDVSLTIRAGEAVGLVGESGSGKSMTAFAILDLFPSPAITRTAGTIRLAGRDLGASSRAQWRAVRGGAVGMIFQDPSLYLDPLVPVGRQIAETLEAHDHDGDNGARVMELLTLMELPRATAIARRYPHELSGGERQRVLIAAALAMRPSLLIADEPTTALDVTVQAGILDLLVRLRAELNLGILLITHDLGIVAQSCQRVYVMYAGRIVETNDVAGLFAAPRHPYTQGLLRSTLLAESASNDLFFIPGRVPTADAMPAGCRFHTRCPIALPDPCATRVPGLMARTGGGLDACWRADDPSAPPPWGAAHV